MKEKIGENNPKIEAVNLKELILKFQRWYRYLLSKWIVILTAVIIGGALGLAYSTFKKPIYKSTTTFVLEESDKSGGLGQYAGLASMVGIDIGGGGGSGIFQGDNILELYRSRRMIEKALLTEVEFNNKNILLIDRFIEFNHLKEKWSDNSELNKITFADDALNSTSIAHQRLRDSVLGSVVYDINKYCLSVSKPDKKLNIIQAEVKCEDEFFAKTFNEQIVKNVNDFYIQTKTKKSLENIAILQQKTDSVRMVMNGDIYSSAATSDATPNLNPTRQIQRSAPMQRSQFSAETNKIILGELVKNLELSKISLRREAPLIQVIDQPVFPLKKESLGKLKGAVIGSLFSGIFISLLLSFRKFIKSILNE